MIQAKFLDVSFKITSKQVKALDDLSLDFSADTVEGEAINGKKSLSVKGLALQSFSLSYLTTTAGGGDPRGEIETLKKRLDRSGFLYIGGKVYGKNRFKLTGVNLSAQEIDHNGIILVATITLNLQETSDFFKQSKQEDAPTVKGTTQKSAVDVGLTTAQKKKIMTEDLKGG